MRLPSFRTCRHRHRRGAVLLPMLVMAGCCTALHAQTSNLSGTIALSSQLVDRGIAITPVTPIAQGALSWASPTGWAAALSASTEARSPGHSAEVLAQVAHYWSFSADWRMQADVIYYDYPGNPGASLFNRAEVGMNWMYRDVLTFGLSGICLTRGGSHHPRGAADVDFHWPLPWHLSVSAGAGVTQSLINFDYGYGADGYRHPHPGSYYGYGHAGLIWSYDAWRVELDRIATAPRQPGGLNAAPWVATVSWSF
jgi:uncharacterized protein (TIGR02001 family)